MTVFTPLTIFFTPPISSDQAMTVGEISLPTLPPTTLTSHTPADPV